MNARRLLVAALLTAVALLGQGGAAFALTVPTEPPDLPPVPTDPIGGDEPTPDPTPPAEPTDPPTQRPDGGGGGGGGTGGTDGTDGPTTTPTTTPVDQGPVTVPGPTTTGTTTFPTTTAPGGVDAPQVATDPSVPGGTPGPGLLTGAGWPRQLQLVGVTEGTAAAFGGVLALGLLTMLVGVAVGFQTFTLTNRGALVARTLAGDIDMDRTRRLRNVMGVSLLGVAALIGVIGFLRISTETLVPVQMVYLASAGFGVVVFGIAGGSLLVAETLRTDEHRVRELEEAITMLARHVAGEVQDPPRLHRRTAADPDTTADGAGEDAVEVEVETVGTRGDDADPTRVVRRVVRRREG